MVKKQSGKIRSYTTICPDQESHKTVPTGAVWGGLAKRVYTAEAQRLLGTHAITSVTIIVRVSSSSHCQGN